MSVLEHHLGAAINCFYSVDVRYRTIFARHMAEGYTRNGKIEWRINVHSGLR